jgi:RNA polymerase sigma-70 factor (ECF subfamily)
MSGGDRAGNDRRWHAAVLAGDEAAWRAGYDAAYDTVRRYVHWRCGGLADLADDAIQETWLMAVRRIGNYDPTRGPFATWVCGISANVVRNSLRSRRRLTLRVGALAGDCPAPSSDIRQDDTAERTARALAELPDHYEAALRDKYLLGLPVAAMAADRGDSVKAVESLLTRARESFRDILERLDRDDG